jgi:hypothetical protein
MRERRLHNVENTHRQACMEQSEALGQLIVVTSSSSRAPAAESLHLVDAYDHQWNSYIDLVPHCLFHRAEYHRVQEEFGHGRACLAVYRGAGKFVAWPYLQHDIVNSAEITGMQYRDVSSVYGYSGPLAFNCAGDPEFLERAWAAIVDNWRRHDVVTVFTRFHPLLGNHDWLRYCTSGAEGAEGRVRVWQAGQTVAIDLSRSPDETLAGYSRAVRQYLRRCQAHGYSTRVDTDCSHLEAFLKIYHETMSRNHAAAFYSFPIEYLEALRREAGQHASLMLTMQGDEIAAAGIVLEYGGIADLHLMGTDSRFLHLSPSKLLVHDIQIWARERGNRYLHLGGGRGSRTDDTLFRFKKEFSRDIHPFYVGRWVLNRQAYDAMNSERRRQCAGLQDRELDPSYFPAYRASVLKQTVAAQRSTNFTQE